MAGSHRHSSSMRPSTVAEVDAPSGRAPRHVRHGGTRMKSAIAKEAELSATITSEDGGQAVLVNLRDARAETLAVFERLESAEQHELSVQAWRLGLHAMQNAYRQADETRLSDIGRTLREDLER